MTVEADMVAAALKRHFGFDAFRPLQEAIVSDVLAGRDVFALLPTGGGKSLCYQLPALLTPGITVVISPLIALMKDQVDALTTAGIAATYLNSSLEYDQVRERIDGLRRGAYRLLYVAPERLTIPSFAAELATLNVTRFAVDEAHCISEWGHDFRPDYRRIAELRERFSNVPFLAFTATATDRVRADILERLALHDPAIHVGSFNRPNLIYRVTRKKRNPEALIAWLRARPDDSGIVYVASRAAADELAKRLKNAGVTALPYHAGLDGVKRSRHQERFIRDEVRVICATVAFGMGIDKSNVRFVVHYDLPKSIEGYYQETGRAGRDGVPAECLLFFNHGDVMKFERFIEEKESEGERAVARGQLERMTRYAYSNDCRRRDLLAYFGETFGELNCGGCDNCLEPRPAVDATEDAQKLLSCIERIRRANGFGVGIAHVIDVLLGAENDKIWRWNHERLTTYGIGKSRPKESWRALADELVRLGYVAVDAQRFNTVSVTAVGRDALNARTPVVVREPPAAAPRGRKRAPSATDDGPYNATVFRALRDVRKELADERDVPAYVVFSDAVLRAMARELPRTQAQLLAISGVGEKKLADFGARFLATIAEAIAER
ncbi:MAG TPA: DNA helicase RecQ [Candidatus Lustribacter sp.]|nr:DNA helicase RecQ [Candidatus Lustribacter sp.]